MSRINAFELMMKSATQQAKHTLFPKISIKQHRKNQLLKNLQKFLRVIMNNIFFSLTVVVEAIQVYRDADQ